MPLSRRNFSVLALAALAAQTVPAAAFPDRPLRLMVPFAPGGSTDATARFLAEALGPALGQSIVVENRAGANGVVGSLGVARAEADGYVLLLASASTHGVNPAVSPQLPFDAIQDFEPIALVGTTPLVLVAPLSFGATLAGFIERLRNEPGRHSYGSAGAGSITHLAGALFKLRANLPDVAHVPYRGGGPAMQAVLTGEIAFTIESLASATALIQAGSIAAFAVTSPARAAAIPSVPTFREAGLPGIEIGTWNMLVAPKGTPRPIVERIAQAARSALATEVLQAKLATVGTIAVASSTPDSARAFLAAEIEKFRDVVRDTSIALTN